MIYHPTPIAGAAVIEPERIEDARGFFARTFCASEFAERGLDPAVVQCNVSFNRRRRTLRGMHYQAAPHEEAKLVRCTMGEIWDVIVDLRPDQPTFKSHFAIDLSARNRRMLFIPAGVAHGFLTLVEECEVFYQMAEVFHPDSARGVRWDDPAFQIPWPEQPAVVSAKDRSYPDFTD